MPRTKPYIAGTDDRLAALAASIAFTLLTPQALPDQILSILASPNAAASGTQLARVLKRRYTTVLASCRDLSRRGLLARRAGRWRRVRDSQTGDL